MAEQKPLMQAEGIGGQVLLFPNTVRIVRKGLRALMLQGMKGDKEIQITSISAIQFKRAGMLTNGYIQFSFIGGVESKKGLFDATQDENTIMFGSKQQPAFEAIKIAIENRRSSPASNTQSSSSIADLEKLAELRDKGIINQSEFDQKKKQILGL